MRLRRKTGLILCCILCLTTLFMGCGRTEVPKDLLIPAISVSRDGSVTAYLAEDFEKEYYDLEELRGMVVSELEEFNKSHKDGSGKDAVELSYLKEYSPADMAQIQGTSMLSSVSSPPKVVLSLVFRDASCYKDYFGTDLFYGTVAKAQEAGYNLDVKLANVKDGKTIGKSEIFGLGSRHILIVEGDVRIFVPGTVQYATIGAAVKEDGSVEPSDTEDNTYIIMK